MIIKTNKINFKINKKNYLKIKPNFFVDRQYPELEDLEITPTTEKQIFKSDKYGYNEVTVNAIKGNGINVFLQQTEPETKEGIWLQTEKEMKNIVIEDNMSIEPVFIKDKYGVGPEFTVNRQRAIVVGTDVYTTSATSLFYKLDTVARTWTKINISFTAQSTHMAYKDGYLYMLEHWESWVMYKYNIADGTFETVTTYGTHPSGNFVGSCVVVNDIMYIMKENSNTWIKYDINTSTFSIMPTLPFTTKSSHGNPNACTDGVNRIYATDNNGVMYMYDIKDAIWTKLIDLNEIVSQDSNMKSLSVHSIVPTYFNGVIYFHSSYTKTDGYSNNVLFTYNISNKALEILKINLHGNTFNNETSAMFLTMGNELILTTGYRNTSIIIPYKTFEDKTVVINQGVSYQTQIIVSPKNLSGRIVNGFNDVWYNTVPEGLDDTIPSYYGDGEKWIKFKN